MRPGWRAKTEDNFAAPEKVTTLYDEVNKGEFSLISYLCCCMFIIVYGSKFQKGLWLL